MLEGLVAGLLNRFLGMYVKNFDPTQLKVGIWSGDVKLRNLELRREALDQLKLPINVVAGHLGELTLVIPWSNLRGAPVKVFIENIFLLASPKEEAEYDEAEEERRRQRLKIEKLDSVELLKEKNEEGMSQEEEKKSQSFTQSLVTKIVDNLQVTIKNIHIRYEDSISAPGHPFALGFVLEQFSAVSTNSQWHPVFIHNSTSLTHKLATLGALAVYWNTDVRLFGSGREAISSSEEVRSHDSIVGMFNDFGLKKDDVACENQYILKPVSGQAKIEMDKSGNVQVPKVKANLLFEEIGLVLDDDQYRDALMMVDLFHYFLRHQEYKALQPKGVTPKQDPRAWLLFAANAVLGKIHERNRKWSWTYFRERRDDRCRYIELFKKKKQHQQLSPDENEELSRLEWKLGYEDLRFWRSLARSQLKRENADTRKNQTQQQQQQQHQQGWLAWMWGSKQEEASDQNDENTQITDEQRKELYDVIDWNEKSTLTEAIDAPRDAIKLCLEASLGTGSFTLKQKDDGRSTDLLSLHFDVFKAKTLQRTDSLLANFSLGGLRVNDGTTPDSLFPEIVRVKDSPRTANRKRLSLVELEQNDEVPFFQFEIEKNPIEREGDIAVIGKLKPLEIIWNPNFVVGIVDFFRPPERHMESITALMESAGATVEGIREQTRAGLEFALEEHKTINAELDLQAPLIIIPASVKTDQSTCLVIDAGHIHVNSDLVDQKTIQDIQAKQRQKYSDDDFKRLESVMYDKFIVKLTSTQVLLGPSIAATKAQLGQEEESGSQFHVVQEINVDFVVEISILPKASNLTKFKVSGFMPMLHVSVSDSKYKSLIRVIDVAIPKLGKKGESQVVLSSDAPSSSLSEPPENASDPSRGKPYNERESSSIFPFIQPHTAVILSDVDDDDGNNDSFEDATDGTPEQHLQIQQRAFEFNFKVDVLKGSLYRSDPDKNKADCLLCELVAERFDLSFYTRPFDMAAEVSLGAVSVEDFVGSPHEEFKSIVYSGDGDDMHAGRSLVHIKFFKVNPQSPEFMPVYEGVETNVAATVSTVNLVVTRNTLLTLLDFILVTFTSNDNEENVGKNQAAISKANETNGQLPDGSQGRSDSSTDVSSIRVKVELKGIRLILNNDGIRLATLSFNHGDAAVFLRANTMRVSAKLGDLSLVDDVNLGVSETSNLRKLVAIEGRELADFRYETFDPASKNGYPGYDSSIFLRAGSVRVNFVEEPFRKIIDFVVKFGRMQALYNAARQAAVSRANQLQSSPSRMKFDIVVKTPIVIFPRLTTTSQPKGDLITANLGEIYAENKFVPLDDSINALEAMKISAGIRNVRLSSTLQYQGDQEEELEMIDHLDLGFQITYAEHKKGLKRPDAEIQGSLSDVKLRLTQHQIKFLLEISNSVPAAFARDDDADEEAARMVDENTLQRARPVASRRDSEDQHLINLSPELGSEEDTWTKADLDFHVGSVGMELITAPEKKPVVDVTASSLSRFSLDSIKVKTRLLSDGSLEAELLIRSFTVYDSRPREANRFRRIMTSTNKEAQQLMASVTMSGGKERNVIAMATIDSPRIIFALDYLYALQRFVTESLLPEKEGPLDDESLLDSAVSNSEASSVALIGHSSEPSRSSVSRTAKGHQKEVGRRTDEPEMNIAVRVNLVDAQIILIANPTSVSSEAIVLGVRQMLLSKQHALTFQVSQVGMFLCRMDKFESSHLRIIDNFSIQLDIDSSQESLTSVHLGIEPLVLRLSLRDILLVLQIINRASELSNDREQSSQLSPAQQKIRQVSDSRAKAKSLRDRGQSTATMTRKSQSKPTRDASTSVADQAPSSGRREDIVASVEGIRVVLIGDLHELPILDIGVKGFTATAENWSSNLKAETSIDLYSNVYSFAKSSWEPLVEPWHAGFGVARESSTGLLSVDLASKKTFDVTITTATIALASKSLQFLTTEQDVLSKPRGAEASYRLRNYTGFEALVRSQLKDDEEPVTLRLDDGQEAPWTFEDWEKMRENLLTESVSNNVMIKLEGSGFDFVKDIRLTREGEFVYELRPKQNNVLHRICVDIHLGSDNVKSVTFRSPFVVENATQLPVELGVYDSQEGHLLKIEKIAPGDSRPAPVGAVYQKQAIVRPDSGFGYRWSRDQLWWRDLLKRPTKQLVCKSENGDAFYFQVHAQYDKTNPMSK